MPVLEANHHTVIPRRPDELVALDRLAAATDELLRLDLHRLRADPPAALALVEDADQALAFARTVIDRRHDRALA